MTYIALQIKTATIFNQYTFGIKSIKISADGNIDSDEIDMLEDMILIAINSAMKQIDEITEKKMGKFNNIPGLF